MKKEKLGTSVFCSLLILLLAEIAFTCGGTALAATMPVFEPLPSIDAQVDKPTAVAVDAQGRLYVAESENNWVRVFTQSGQYLATLTGLAKPISVAVDAAGRIYVGSASLGNVTVFAADFTKLLKLGKGDGEFIEPADIDIDTSGQIYVVDKDNNTVRVYNASGALFKSIGAMGNGQLYHPTSLAIDPVSSELVIIDHPLILDEFSGQMVDGARIQFLGMDGTFRRGYPKFGYDMNAGQLVKPMQVTVDPENRIYVSDSRWQKVMVYSKTGVFLGMIDNSTHPLRTPLGLCMATSGRLYVASLLGEQVDVYGIDAHSAMSLAPSTLNFTTTESGNAPDPQNVTIKNSGKQALTWTAVTTADWLNLDTAVGTLEPTKTGALAVGVKNTGLAQGSYQGSISIMVLGMTEKVAVTLTVKPNPLLVSPDSLSFTTTTGTNPVTQPLSVTNAGTDKLNWSATADQPWLKLSKATGHAPDQIEIDADVSNLALGTHTATITFINDSTGGSVQVPVSLSITKPNPLQVSPASLSFTTTTGTNPSPQTLSVANAETDPLHWSTTADQSWLNLSKAAGSAPDQVEIGVNISTLKTGTHTATITFINDSTGGSILVPVSLTINESNPLQVNPASLSLTITKKTSPSILATTKGTKTNMSSLTLSGMIEGQICPPLNWTATADQSWLKLSKGKGATPDQVTIVADISALALGPHTATITFSNNSTGGSVLVPVSLNVSEPNPLLVSPARLSFKTKTNTNPSTLALSVANAAGKAPLEWNAAANQSWLKLSKDKGSTPDDKVEINADASALAPGTYTGTITFSSTSGNVLVPVTLRVGTFPWLIIIQDIAIIGEQQQKQDQENKSKTSNDQQPAKISGPEAR